METRLETRVEVRSIENLEEIATAFKELLFVPDGKLKNKVVLELTKYISAKRCVNGYKIEVFGAYQGDKLTGVVASVIHPTYLSYGRTVGTFGWLSVNDFESCKALIRECENFT